MIRASLIRIKSTNHVGSAIKSVSFDDKLYSQEPVIYRANNEDDDVAQIVVENLKKTSRRFIRNLTLQKMCPSNTKIGVSSKRQGDAGSVRVHLTRTK